MLLKMLLSAVVTFFAVKQWILFIMDPSIPREFPYLMFELVGWFALTYPFVVSVIALVCEKPSRLKNGVMSIGLTISLLIACSLLFSVDETVLTENFFKKMLTLLVMTTYCFSVLSGLTLLTFRFLRSMLSLMRYLALKSI